MNQDVTYGNCQHCNCFNSCFAEDCAFLDEGGAGQTRFAAPGQGLPMPGVAPPPRLTPLLWSYVSVL
jgi:hypothetical protein